MEALRFDTETLFGHYRSEEVESVEVLRPSRPLVTPSYTYGMEVEEEPPQRSLPCEEVPFPHAATEELTLMLEKQASLVYTLFAYLGEDYVNKLMPSMEAFRALIHDRCKPLLGVVNEQAPKIEAVWRVFVQRMLVEMLAVDARGVKIREVLTALEELYLVRGGKSNLANLDEVHRLTRETTAESLNFAGDDFYHKCAGPKKRGRRPGSENQQVPHQLNLIKAHFVTKKSGAAPALDTYPLFVKVLSIFNDCVPAHHNHGWYLETLHRAVRCLTWREWPARGLVRSLLNAEAVLERRRRVLTEEDVVRPRHCAYSGLSLVAGEEVWHLRILLNSGERHREWVKAGRLPAEPNTDPLFTSSVRAYLIKARIVSLCSVFYAPLPVPESVIVLPPPLKFRNNGLPPNRQYSLNTLWLLLNQLRNFIADNRLGPYIFHRTEAGGSYAEELARLGTVLSQLGEQSFPTHLRTFLLVATFGEAYLKDICEGRREAHPNVAAYAEMLKETVLDFIDLMFSFTVGRTPLTRDVVVFRQFNLPLFEVVMNETAQSRKRFLAENGSNKDVRPRVREAAQELLAQLLAMSAERAAEGQSHQAQRERLSLVEMALAKHPFLFMTIYEFLFQPEGTARLSSLPDSVTLLNKMGLCINTSK
jgi:hypothetical protein